MSRLVALIAIVLLGGLAGCVARVDRPADLVVVAKWASWEDETLPHLWITMRNEGGSPATVGPAGDAVRVTGPTTAIPVLWGTPFSTTIGSGETVTAAFHPRALADEPLALTLDHSAGVPVRMPPGIYQVCVGAACSNTNL